MALTRDFKATVLARVQADPAFARLASFVFFLNRATLYQTSKQGN
jgi:hypothetical protein